MFEPERGRVAWDNSWNENVEEAASPDRWRSAAQHPSAEDRKPQPQQTRVPQPSRGEDWASNRPAEAQPTAVTTFQTADGVKHTDVEAGHKNLSPAEHRPSSIQVERLIERHVETRQTVVEHHELQIERTRTPPPTKEFSPSSPPRREVVEIRKEAPKADGQVRPQNDTPPSRSEAAQKPTLPPAPIARTRLHARPAPVALTPPPAPTIQVTIGRIELRSPQPAPSTKTGTQRSRAPKLGLDDYLRRREGGVQ